MRSKLRPASPSFSETKMVGALWDISCNLHTAAKGLWTALGVERENLWKEFMEELENDR